MFKKLTLVFLAAFTLSAADSFVGTWKANMARSKYSPGPALRSSTVTYTQDGDWIVSTIAQIDSEGKPATAENRYKRDGKEYPFTRPAGDKGMIAMRSVNATTTEATLKIGAATTITRNVMAGDGKSFTRTTTGTDTKGQKVKNVVVFEKQ
jgi:hypothetical protein